MAKRPDKKTMNLLKKQILHLRQSFNPNKIILFGSRARGDNMEESDVDLIVVSNKFSNIDFKERIIQAYGSWDKKQGLDILCYTPEEFKEKRKQIGIVKQAVKEGIPL